ncbi:4-hydroxybenzoate polyprenyltransferase [Methylobacillus rhizosphaerae]|uniref:4-hydroxybenzoate octaprenyltransferase n=2 Tax=Methylobacillus rhizosphaerae TaxID=551994 RepID=A0A238ZEF8_9PROT|nr:4-hydroxybenzoate polyprenyltransferase [Methylobacillus rhizosphaerae]
MKKLQAYYCLTRLDKPIGTLLLLWPTLWAIWLASPSWPDGLVLGVFVAGTVLMRSAGCVMNDLADRNFDGHVERTRQRPLVTGEVSVREALLLAAGLSLVAFLLVLQLNMLAVYLSFPALFLAATYPLTKRFFSIPQAYLGIAFGFGIPMAFAAITGTLPLEAWVMLLANVFWAVAYDTEYAMVDRDDDLKIGIKSSAIFFGRWDVLAVMGCYAAFLLLMAWVGVRMQVSWIYFAGLATAACIAVYHYTLIRNRMRQPCFRAFLHNNWLGAAVFAGVFLSDYL